jgi:hypothetical protein
LCTYTEDCELVINAESYDPEEQSFNFALRLKDEAPDSVWQFAEQMGVQDGWLFLTMDSEGKYERMEP